MKSKFISALTALAIIFSLMPTTFAAAETEPLFNNWTEAAEAAVQGTDYTQSGTTYIVKTAKGLAWLAKEVNNGQTSIDVTLANNIDLSGVVDDRELSKENSWIPIGKDSQNQFSGMFNGQGHTISGMRIKNEQMYQGLFGIISGKATITNVKVDNAELNVRQINYAEGENSHESTCIGGIAGHNGGRIQNCESKAYIVGEYAGGIAGENYGEIYGCKSDSHVEGISNVGIITGCNFDGKGIYDCESRGEVTGVFDIGGISGDNARSTIQNCKNYAKVTGQLWVGGITGITSYSSLITDCQNVGEVTSKPISTLYVWNIGEVGGITGRVDSSQGFSQVKQCYNSGSVKCEGADSLNVGGIVGCSYQGGVISDCVNDGSVLSKDWKAGGIVGDFDTDKQNADMSKVVNCVNNGEVHAKTYAGGIAGANVHKLENCYNTGNITSDKGYAGGIVGANAATSDGYNILEVGIITNCYSIGTVTASENLGAIAGDNFANSSITGCYYPEGQTVAAGNGSVTDCASYNANNTLQDGTFLYQALNNGVGKYGAENWKQWSASDEAPAVFGHMFQTWNEAGEAAEAGTDYTINGDTYTIYTPLGLAFIANTVNGGNTLQGKTVVLNNDIDLAGTVNDADLNDENSWNPIGDYNIKQPNNKITCFNGTFDGQNHTVSGMKINREIGNQGLFGEVSIYGEVKNLGVINSSITVNDSFSSGTIEYNAIIVAQNQGGIRNCYTGENTSVNSNGYWAGGIVGRNSWWENNIIEDCHNMATVTTGRGEAGGIVASNSSGTIKNSSNSGTITSNKSYAGGIAGLHGQNCNIAPVIINCYNEGEVTSSDAYAGAGGIVGWNSSYNRRISIINSYNTAAVKAVYRAGGICGDCRNMSDILNCYNSGSITSTKNIAGSIVGYLGNQETNIENCHYLSSSAAKPIGDNKTAYTPVNCNVFGNDGIIVDTEKSLCDALNDGVHLLNNNDALTWTKGEGFAEFGEPLSEGLTVEALKLVKPPASSYIQGQTFNPSGMVITLLYSNGSQADVAYSEENADEFTFTPALDTQLAMTDTEISVEYAGKTVLVPITVNEKNVTGINVSTLPEKTTYLEGQELDLTGMVVTAAYDNGDREPITGYDVTGYDKDKVGNQNVTVSCGGFTASFTVTVKAKTVTGIKILSEPAKKEFKEGSAIDVSGLVLQAQYDNGTTTIITDYTVNGYDKNTVGKQTVTISYNGFDATFDVEVTAKTLTGITVNTDNMKTTYVEGKALDLTGLVVTAQYDNGAEQAVAKGDYKASGYSRNIKGIQTVTIEYEGFKAQFDVEVVDKTLTGLKILLLPPKRDYIEGEEIDTSGLVLWAMYDNGTGQNVLGRVTGYDKNKIGTQLVSAEYGGFTVEFTVTVAAKSLTDIVVAHSPFDTEYIEGEELNLNGLSVTAKYNNGTSEEVTDYTVTGYDKNKIGKQTLTVSHGGLETTFDINVEAKCIAGTKITKLPDRTNYVEGQDLNLDGMELTVYYNNGTTEVVDNYTVSGYDKDVVGEQLVTVEYEGKIAKFFVTVTDKSITQIEIASEPTKTTYIEGQDLELAGLSVTATYNNGTQSNVTGYDVTGYDKNTPGEQTVTVEYAGQTAQFTVNVEAKVLLNIMIIKLPDKTDYIEEQDLDLTGICVIANYNNGISEEITDYNVSMFDNTAYGMQTIVLEYKGQTATFGLTVAQKQMTKLAITSMPEQITYVQGQDLNIEGMMVTASYDNGKSEAVEDYNITGFDSTVTGRQTVVVEYGLMSDSFNIIVAEKDDTPRINAAASLDTAQSVAEITAAPENCGAGVIVAALYKDGVIIAVKTIAYNGTDAPDALRIPYTAEPDKIKVMLWDSLDGMKPLCNAETPVGYTE